MDEAAAVAVSAEALAVVKVGTWSGLELVGVIPKEEKTEVERRANKI